MRQQKTRSASIKNLQQAAEQASGLPLLCIHSGAEERNGFVKLQQRLLVKHTPVLAL
jgi:hypothetical protein